MKKYLDVFGYLVLLSCIVFLVLKDRDNKTPPEIPQPTTQETLDITERLKGQAFPKFKLGVLDSDETRTFPSLDKQKPLCLFVLFTPMDCPKCFTETPFWLELFESYKDEVQFHGIVSGEDVNHARAFVRSHDLPFTVLHDKDFALLNRVVGEDIGVTPLKVITDFRGEILAVSKTTYDHRPAQEDFIARLEELLAREKQSPPGI